MTECIDHGKKGNHFGYSTKSVGGRPENGGVVVMLHRWVFAEKMGIDVRALPGSVHVRHTCDNPRCINPDHLIEGTQQDNIQDCVTQQRHAHGERNGKARLTLEDVLKIRESTLSIKELALKYSVAPRTIRDVINNVTWRLT